MLYERKDGCWQSGAFSAASKPGWKCIRVVADLDRRLSYALVRHEDSTTEDVVAWETPVELKGKGMSVNALYLRTDFGYSKHKAYFADLKVQPTPPFQPPLS